MRRIVAVRLDELNGKETITAYYGRAKNRGQVWAADVTGMTHDEVLAKAMDLEDDRALRSEPLLAVASQERLP